MKLAMEVSRVAVGRAGRRVFGERMLGQMEDADPGLETRRKRLQYAR